MAACIQVPIDEPPGTEPVEETQTSESTASESMKELDTLVPEQGAEAQATQSGASVQVEERLLSGAIISIGSADAPMTLRLYTHTSCRYCREFHEVLLPRLITDYVAGGALRIEIAPFLIEKYPRSLDAAVAILCAAEQGKGRAMLDFLFTSNGIPPTTTKAAADLSIDGTLFAECMKSEDRRAMIEQEHAISVARGIEWVPTFFLNNEKHVGLPRYAELRGMIDEMFIR